ncbi:MAG TPA: histidine kinase N-terminal domain-containing protein, partial [Pseudonocardiaceae bacterium]|nr:histidine kinase N-terminal domain-containing protein [Pseudonocardiaceae bacterium]
MSTLTDLLAEHTPLSGAAVDHLQRVVAEWQLLADLSFADFLLWVPLPEDPHEPAEGAPHFLCIAQCRPTTTLTAHHDDMVGTVSAGSEHPQLHRALGDARICREEDPVWRLGVPVRREVIPVLFDQRVIAVLSRDTNLAVPRVPSSLEIAYLGSAADLCQMIADGTFPANDPSPDVHTSPRVGDGLIRLDAAGAVVFASPNALSAYHRMGHAADLIGARLSPLTRALIADPFDATEVAQRIRAALDGQSSTRFEAETRQGASVLFRAMPLRPKGKAAGALVLVRDVTEVKRKDRALLSKDATIREIHHRVKNNLQTISSLLRLHGRRLESPEARAAVEESVRRIRSIALVHETLSAGASQEVDLGEIVRQLVRMVGEGIVADDTPVRLVVEGDPGEVRAEVATPLAVVLTELLQ